jgi:hypothetical protein
MSPATGGVQAERHSVVCARCSDSLYWANNPWFEAIFLLEVAFLTMILHMYSHHAIMVASLPKTGPRDSAQADRPIESEVDSCSTDSHHTRSRDALK